eukprot:jgi/Chlat1/1572/Chrsp123S01837
MDGMAEEQQEEQADEEAAKEREESSGDREAKARCDGSLTTANPEQSCRWVLFLVVVLMLALFLRRVRRAPATMRVPEQVWVGLLLGGYAVAQAVPTAVIEMSSEFRQRRASREVFRVLGPVGICTYYFYWLCIVHSYRHFSPSLPPHFYTPKVLLVLVYYLARVTLQVTLDFSAAIYPFIFVIPAVRISIHHAEGNVGAIVAAAAMAASDVMIFIHVCWSAHVSSRALRESGFHRAKVLGFKFFIWSTGVLWALLGTIHLPADSHASALGGWLRGDNNFSWQERSSSSSNVHDNNNAPTFSLQDTPQADTNDNNNSRDCDNDTDTQQHKAPHFTLETAVRALNFALAAYYTRQTVQQTIEKANVKHGTEFELSLQVVDKASDSNVRFYTSRDHIVVAFRGTSSLTSALTDAQFLLTNLLEPAHYIKRERDYASLFTTARTDQHEDNVGNPPPLSDSQPPLSDANNNNSVAAQDLEANMSGVSTQRQRARPEPLHVWHSQRNADDSGNFDRDNDDNMTVQEEGGQESGNSGIEHQQSTTSTTTTSSERQEYAKQRDALRLVRKTLRKTIRGLPHLARHVFAWMRRKRRGGESNNSTTRPPHLPTDETGEVGDVLDAATGKQSVSGGSGVKVHTGFLYAWRRIADQVFENLAKELSANNRRKVLITGHSLGGALATLCAYDVRRVMKLENSQVSTYTFGSPRVGNGAFVRAYDDLVPVSFRIVHARDEITYLPYSILGFRHVSHMVLLDRAHNNLIIQPSFAEVAFIHDLQWGSLQFHFLSAYARALRAWKSAFYKDDGWDLPIWDLYPAKNERFPVPDSLNGRKKERHRNPGPSPSGLAMGIAALLPSSLLERKG